MPETVSLQTQKEGKVCIGDSAEVRLDPGLLRFLMTEVTRGGNRPGRRIHPMSGIPLGIAIEAAILAASGKKHGIDVLRACECDYLFPIGIDDSVVAYGEVIELGKRHISVLMELRRLPDHKLLMKGKAVLVHSLNGKAQNIEHVHGDAEN
jgi:hypothetical protein